MLEYHSLLEERQSPIEELILSSANVYSLSDASWSIIMLFLTVARTNWKEFQGTRTEQIKGDDHKFWREGRFSPRSKLNLYFLLQPCDLYRSETKIGLYYIK